MNIRWTETITTLPATATGTLEEINIARENVRIARVAQMRATKEAEDAGLPTSALDAMMVADAAADEAFDKFRALYFGR